jgi:hypothetical protein
MSSTKIACMLAVASTTALLVGCAGGPSDGEFVQACMNQKGLQMVKVTESMCQCASKFAHERFDPKLQRVLVLDMQGKKQEEEALVDGMSFDDRAKFAGQQFEMVGKCLEPG